MTKEWQNVWRFSGTYLSLLGTSSWAGLRRKVALGLVGCSLWGRSCLVEATGVFLAERLILSSSMLISFSESLNYKTIKVEFGMTSHLTWTFYYYYKWPRRYISRYDIFSIIVVQRKLVPECLSSHSQSSLVYHLGCPIDKL